MNFLREKYYLSLCCGENLTDIFSEHFYGRNNTSCAVVKMYLAKYLFIDSNEIVVKNITSENFLLYGIMQSTADPSFRVDIPLWPMD